MDSSVIQVERKGALALIIINRPEVRNALDVPTWGELSKVFCELEGDSSINVILITGAGNKAFVAGADLNSLYKRSSLETLEGTVPKAITAIAKSKKPTIAVLNGYTMGGGLELALACDLRIASTNAKLGQTESNVGILPGGGGTQRLARLVGVGKAKELIFTGKVISADEAKNIGLVNQVYPQENLLDEAFALGELIAKKSPLILRIAKKVIDEGLEINLSAALELEAFAQSFVFTTGDHLEGIGAFLEKRQPEYKGK